jgi:hypothetical protein
MSVLPARLRRGAAALVAVAVTMLAGCELSTESGNDPAVTVAWQPPSIAAPVAEDASRVGITAGTHFVQGLGGVIVAPCLTANRNARLEIASGVIKIRMIMTPNNSACASGPGASLGYNVYVINVPPGAYTVRVVHEGDQLVPSGTVVKETNVTVL